MTLDKLIERYPLTTIWIIGAVYLALIVEKLS